jgi:hypothetical protein
LNPRPKTVATRKDLDPTSMAMMQAYTAAGFLLQNHKEAAEKLLAEAEKSLEGDPTTSGERVTYAVVQGLRGKMPFEDVMSVARESDATAHGWFVAAVRAANAGEKRRASDYFARSARAASDFDFPYLEAKAMARVADLVRN